MLSISLSHTVKLTNLSTQLSLISGSRCRKIRKHRPIHLGLLLLFPYRSLPEFFKCLAVPTVPTPTVNSEDVQAMYRAVYENSSVRNLRISHDNLWVRSCIHGFWEKFKNFFSAYAGVLKFDRGPKSKPF